VRWASPGKVRGSSSSAGASIGWAAGAVRAARAWARAAMLAAAVAATERAVYEGAAVARAAVPSEVSAGGEGGRDGGEGTRERRWREEAWVVGGGMSLESARWLEIGEGGLEEYRPGDDGWGHRRHQGRERSGC
jgi:hypothetical protein